MPRVRAVAAAQPWVSVTQRGRPVDARTARGPIRLALAVPDPLPFGTTGARFVAATAAAAVWRVTQGDGTEAALKVYLRGDPGNEASGVNWLRAHSDRGAARLLAAYGAAQLIDWLPGPTLGDIARGGDIARADALLGAAAARLHTAPPPTVRGLTPQAAQLDDLAGRSHRTDRTRALFGRATDLGRALLDSAPADVPLHGDLHHDNVILTGDGPRVFDPKGLRGDPAYELANALRNPRGCSTETADPARVTARIALWTPALGVAPERLLQWGAVKCALSIAWRGRDGAVGDDSELPRLDMLLDLAGG